MFLDDSVPFFGKTKTLRAVLVLYFLQEELSSTEYYYYKLTVHKEVVIAEVVDILDPGFTATEQVCLQEGTSAYRYVVDAALYYLKRREHHAKINTRS